MSSQPTTYLTPEEYLAIERKAAYKSEYVDGGMVAMTGASRRHNLIDTVMSPAATRSRNSGLNITRQR